MRGIGRIGWWPGVVLLLGAFASHFAQASAPGCGQAQVEALLGAPPPPGPTQSYIYPRQDISPFYQWESNNGYCGETSLMIGGLANGQWMSQFNARLVCGAFFGLESNHAGASLLQAGNPLGTDANYNAQLLIEDPDTGVSGPYDFAHASLCGANSRLATVTYPYRAGYKQPNYGLDGYRDYMRWIKAQVIAGNQVTVAVYMNGGYDTQYDHEVSVLKIGTNHSPTDDGYYGDDVLYFDDHGAYTLRFVDGHWGFAWNPSVPPGAGQDDTGCTPYIFGYTFDSLANTRQGANAEGAPGYSIAIPDDKQIVTGSGNIQSDGSGVVRIKGPHNYGFAVTGPVDPQHVTLPARVSIERSESLNNGAWNPNPWDENSDPPAGNNYETPYIGGPLGTCNEGDCVTNTQPASMLMTLRVTVSGLQKGEAYNLYEYELPSLTGAETGASAALAVPTENFNANANAASAIVHFIANGPTYVSAPIDLSSARIAVFRAVPASAP
jgi:hypothetical protein